MPYIWIPPVTGKSLSQFVLQLHPRSTIYLRFFDVMMQL